MSARYMFQPIFGRLLFYAFLLIFWRLSIFWGKVQTAKPALSEPLKDLNILLTAPSDSSIQNFAERLVNFGAKVKTVALIETRPLPFDPSCFNYTQADWLFFTSKNAVHTYFQALLDCKRTVSQPIAVIGPGTSKALETYGYTASFISPIANAQAAATGFLDYLKKEGQLTAHPNIRWPCGNRAYSDLADTLRAGGCEVKPIIIYETVNLTLRSEEKNLIQNTLWDCIVFSSGSAVEAYTAIGKESQHNPLYACLGQKTENAVLAAKLSGQCLQGKHSSYDSLAEAILQKFSLS